MQFSVILRRRSRRRIFSPAAAGRRKKILRCAQDDRGEALRRTESEIPSGGQRRKYPREDSVGSTLRIPEETVLRAAAKPLFDAARGKITLSLYPTTQGLGSRFFPCGTGFFRGRRGTGKKPGKGSRQGLPFLEVNPFEPRDFPLGISQRRSQLFSSVMPSIRAVKPGA